MFAENLKAIRQELGLSVAKFADLLEMSASTLTNYERGERTPSYNLFTQLNIKANVNLNWFVSGKGEMFIDNTEQPLVSDDFLEEKVVAVMQKYGVIAK